MQSQHCLIQGKGLFPSPLVDFNWKEGVDMNDPRVSSVVPMMYTKEHALKAKNGCDFIILGGNPGSGTSIKDVIRASKEMSKAGDEYVDFAGVAGRWNCKS